MADMLLLPEGKTKDQTMAITNTPKKRIFHSRIRPLLLVVAGYIAGRQFSVLNLSAVGNAWMTALLFFILLLYLVTSDDFVSFLAKRKTTKRRLLFTQWGVSVIPSLLVGLILVAKGVYSLPVTSMPDLTLNKGAPTITASDNTTIKLAFPVYNVGNSPAYQIEASMWVIDNSFQMKPSSINSSISNILKSGEGYLWEINFNTPYTQNGTGKYSQYQDYYFYCVLKYSDKKVNGHSYVSPPYGYEYNLNIPNYVAMISPEIERKILSIIPDK